MRERRYHAAELCCSEDRYPPCRCHHISFPFAAFAFIVLSGVGAYGPMGVLGHSDGTLPSRIVGSVMGFVNAIGTSALLCASHCGISE